jgi:hypothetical protein
LNPFAGLAQYFLGRLEQKIIQHWVRLIFQMGLSALITFLFICGAALVAGAELEIAVGSGMVMVALVLTVYSRTSKELSGMLFVLPAEEAQKEIDTNFQTITRPEEKK